MRSQDLLWLAGAIWFGLGVADDNLTLKLFALAAWAGSAYKSHRDRQDR